jgi:transposase
MYHFFMFNREEFLRFYHARSNVETTFHMIKAKFGTKVRSKTETAQVNEILCKLIAHNLCCLVHAFYELGVEATFWQQGAAA